MSSKLECRQTKKSGKVARAPVVQPDEIVLDQNSENLKESEMQNAQELPQIEEMNQQELLATVSLVGKILTGASEELLHLPNQLPPKVNVAICQIHPAFKNLRPFWRIISSTPDIWMLTRKIQDQADQAQIAQQELIGYFQWTNHLAELIFEYKEIPHYNGYWEEFLEFCSKKESSTIYGHDLPVFPKCFPITVNRALKKEDQHCGSLPNMATTSTLSTTATTSDPIADAQLCDKSKNTMKRTNPAVLRGLKVMNVEEVQEDQMLEYVQATKKQKKKRYQGSSDEEEEETPENQKKKFRDADDFLEQLALQLPSTSSTGDILSYISHMHRDDIIRYKWPNMSGYKILKFEMFPYGTVSSMKSQDWWLEQDFRAQMCLDPQDALDRKITRAATMLKTALLQKLERDQKLVTPDYPARNRKKTFTKKD